jgi:hypothetical protein
MSTVHSLLTCLIAADPLCSSLASLPSLLFIKLAPQSSSLTLNFRSRPGCVSPSKLLALQAAVQPFSSKTPASKSRLLSLKQSGPSAYLLHSSKSQIYFTICALWSYGVEYAVSFLAATSNT